jgi:hypothetical protein
MQCKICKNEYKRLSSHILKSHELDYKDYLIRYEHNNSIPKCECGCGEDAPYTKSHGLSFNRFIHGHSIKIRALLSKEARESISRKNSKHMKKYFKDNPEKRKEKGIQLQAGVTEASEAKRIASMKKTYSNMSHEDKQKFRDHSTSLWEENRELMESAREKGAETWKQRYENGEYDFEERNSKISKSITQLYLDGGQKWARGKYTSTMSNNTYHYRSSWELRYMKELDEDINVTSWDYEPFSIEYILDEKVKRYIPDFIVKTKTGQILVEVKPESLKSTKVNLLKEESARQWCKENNHEYRTVSY